MKKRLSLKRIACCIIILAGSFVSFTTSASFVRQCDGEDIWIHPLPANAHGSPHMPAYVPFYAELGSGNVLLGSTASYGVVDVCLTSTAGDYYTTVFDTADGTVIIPISGLTGDYTLLITTASGVEYYGEFVL